MMRKNYQLLLFVLLSFNSCKENNKGEIEQVNNGIEDSIAYYQKGISIEKSNDRVIWKDEKVKIYANHSVIEEGEEKLLLYTNKKDTLLTFFHEDGGKITFPFVINSNDETFINFFEVWEGSGFLSSKNFYHLNTNNYSLDRVAEVDHKNLLRIVKKRFNIEDSIYTKTGEFYKNYSFDKTCFNEKGELPFTVILYNYDQPELNKGLEGFKTMKGLYSFEKEKGYILKPTKIELQN
ncbi:hypothetical protein [uncultured Aquimarina sp.]|uniref:hypothetical protein n=1 Tax=uncultured Aquimarina sp. TaxID=575652 RepID=UPI002618525E|nr:hypothetical protein [uncultured Aquimarina sp.]